MDSVELSGLKNFLRIDEHIATSGQPSEAELHAVRAAGFEVLVNLGLVGQAYSLADEAASAEGLGFEYHHIPVQFTAPTATDFAAFERAVLASGDRKVFVHCALNYRVSCFMALFGERHLGWSREHADQHIQRVWTPDEVWSRFLGDVRASRQAV